jgi:hypothetical protein
MLLRRKPLGEYPSSAEGDGAGHKTMEGIENVVWSAGQGWGFMSK